jgi:HPt (histidine-containing phosphotransfer) domain-containing protein
MFGEMVGCLFEDAQRLIPQMQAALARGDLKALGDLGHRLKGTLVYLGAKPAVDAARAVERCGEGGTREAAEAVKVLERQVEKLKMAIAAYRPASESSQV